MHYIQQAKQNIQSLQTRFGAYATTAALLIGFVIDTLTLTRIDQLFDNLIFIIHLVISGTIIVLTHVPFRKNIITKELDKARLILNTLIAFSFGALFSGLTIFYIRSSSLLTSLPFLALLVGIMLLVEIRKNQFERTVSRILVYSIAWYSYLGFAVPVVVKRIGIEWFLLSGVLMLVILSGLILVLKKINTPYIEKIQRKLAVTILGVFVLFMTAYATNIVPPVPLSMKYGQAFYSVERTNQGYEAVHEPTPWYIFWKPEFDTIKAKQGEPIYVFTQTFAPNRLRTDVYHQWEYYDEATNKWTELDRIQIPITGGRDEGYRGFSLKRNYEYGHYRVSVETNRGQSMGFVRFEIESGEPKTTAIKEL